MAGRLINDVRVAVLVSDGPSLTASPDPHLLAIAVAGSADFLITGDKRDLLSLGRHAGTTILTVRSFLERQRRMP